MIKSIIVILILLFGASQVKAYESLKLVTVELLKREELRFIQENDFDVAGIEKIESSTHYLVDIVVNWEEESRLLSFGFEPLLHLTSNGGGGAETRGLDNRYKNPREVENILRRFYQDYPNLTQLVEIGKSTEGRSIWALRITDHPEKQEIGEPAVLFNSMHHAREIITPEVSLDIIEFLLSQYHQSEKVRFWVDHLDIWVVPMLNVDGNNKVWSGHPFWRKNTREGHGVDLNRNYPSSNWGTCRGSSGHSHSDTYRGPSPGSEAETKALMKLVEFIRPVVNISYHSYSNMVIYPLGCRGDKVADIDLIEGIGKKLAGILDYSAGTAWELLYSADGGDIDWMYEKWGVIPFVLELTSRQTGFHPPYSKKQVTVERNRPGWQFLLNRIFQGGIDLRVSGELESDNTEVLIRKENSEKLLGHYYLKDDGTLQFLLVPGTYDIQIKNGSKIHVRRVIVGNRTVRMNENF